MLPNFFIYFYPSMPFNCKSKAMYYIKIIFICFIFLL